MNENSPISEVLYGCCCNDPTAQRVLYARYFSFGLNLCLRYAQDEEEAKYMLNEVFLKHLRVLNNTATTVVLSVG
jgi:hypothetical protein